MPNQFLSPEGDLENYFVTEYWLIDQYIGDELWTWGNGGSGRLGNAATTLRSTPVTTSSGGTNWKQVSGGSSHTVAIKTDGTLWVWGNGGSGRLGNAVTTNTSTPVTTFAGGTDWKQVSAGNSTTLAIKTDGTLWVWGDNGSSQLGTNDTVLIGSRSTPVTTFAGGTNWKQVSTGWGHSAAIKTDGTLWIWGSPRDDGCLGNGQTSNTAVAYTPITTFAGGTNWKQVSCGGQISTSNTTAIKTDGTLWTWGNGSSEKLGNALTTNRSTPVTTFTGGTNWKQVSTGGYHTAAVKTDGTLWTWGSDGSRQLGRLSVLQDRSTPVTTFAGGTNWADTATTEPEDLYTISAGFQYTSAIKTDGTLWIWGNGSFSRLGTNDLTTRSTPVTTFSGGTNWKQVSTGKYRHTAAIKTDGTLWTWGDGTSGALGNNDITDRNTPVTTFAGGTNWKQVSPGYDHTAAIKTDGTLWVWGGNNIGQLGTNDTTNVSTPVTTFAGGTNWKQVSTGGYLHTAAIKTDGTLWVWGNGGSGRLGTNDEVTRSTPITTFAGGTNWKQVSCGGYFTSAIKTDGTLWTWGYGLDGELGNALASNSRTPVTTFAGGTNWKQVSSGAFHTAAIKTDGTLWVWGYNGDGRLGNNITTVINSTPVTAFAGGTNWKQVSSGGAHTIALKDDGANKEIYVFGFTAHQQLGINYSPNGQDKVEGTNWKQVSVSKGDNGSSGHTVAIKTDGTLWTWGNGLNGRLGNGIIGNFNRTTPVTTFAGGTSWKQVSAGDRHTAAVTSGISPDLPLS